jgi:hypothetical protein
MRQFLQTSPHRRCCPHEQVDQPLKDFDDAIMLCFEESTGIALDSKSREQAQLSLGSGGMGLRSLFSHAPAAYISSVACTGAQGLPGTSIDLYNSRIAEPDRLETSGPIPASCKSQKNLSRCIDKQAWTSLVASSTSTGDLARLRAVPAPNTSDWLSVVPSPGLGLRLEPNEVQSLVKMRLGLPLSTTESTCAYCPDKVLDPLGHHALTCRRGPDVVHRHNRLRDTIHEYCKRAMMNPILEQGARLDEAGSLSRPADILVQTWSLGHSGALDVTVVHPLNNENIHGASTSSDHCECGRAEETPTERPQMQ